VRAANDVASGAVPGLAGLLREARAFAESDLLTAPGGVRQAVVGLSDGVLAFGPLWPPFQLLRSNEAMPRTCLTSQDVGMGLEASHEARSGVPRCAIWIRGGAKRACDK
jgi:hypothetical protein